MTICDNAVELTVHTLERFMSVKTSGKEVGNFWKWYESKVVNHFQDLQAHFEQIPISELKQIEIFSALWLFITYAKRVQD